MTMLRIALVAARALVIWPLMLVPHGVCAEEDPPKIDSEKYCDALSALNDSNKAVQDAARDRCISNEEDYAFKLARVWAKIPEADRDRCRKMLAISQSSNMTLAGCIEIAIGKRFLDGDTALCK